MSTATATAAGRVLVVDDEENISFLVESALRLAGYDTTSAASGRDAVEVAGRFGPDVVVLDVMLPDIDGFTVLRRLREAGTSAAVIFLTARSATEDRVRGLTDGDDYVVKPFAVPELLARVALALRRRGLDPADTDVFRCADLVLDDEAHRVTRGGQVVSLSPTEYNLLRYLLLNLGRVVTRSQILDAVWDYDFAGETSIVDTFISYLRRKVDTADAKLIHTVRGTGFCLRSDL